MINGMSAVVNGKIGTHLSRIVIDTDKDWAARKIENLGAPDSSDDAPRDDTIDSKINTHKGDASAHHTKTTDNEVYGLVQAGTAAARPAAGVAGRWYFATDTLILSRDNGTSWVEMARGETAIRLAQLSEKAHSSLTGLADDDHTQYIKKVGASDLGRDFKRVNDIDCLRFWGGLNHPALLTLRGKSNPSYAGELWGEVPNAAGDGWAWAFRFSGCTDNPEMVEGVIPKGRLKTTVAAELTGTIANNNYQNFMLQKFSFSPSIESPSSWRVKLTTRYGQTRDETARFALFNDTGGTITYYINYHYLSSSGNPEIWIGLDEEKNMVAVHPAIDAFPITPPMSSDSIHYYIHIKLTDEMMQELVSKLTLKFGQVIMEESAIADGKLTFRDFSFDVDIKNKEDVPRMRRVTKTITRMEKRQKPVMVEQQVFNEWTGKFEPRLVQKTERVLKDHWRLVDGEPIKEQAWVDEPIFEEKEFEVKEEIEVEELIA